jgi:lysophospholipase L1-like esterase
LFCNIIFFSYNFLFFSQSFIIKLTITFSNSNSKILCKPKYKKRSDTTTTDHEQWLSENGANVKSVLVGTSMFERFSYMPEAKRAWLECEKLDANTVFNCSVGGDKIESILYRLETRRILDSIPLQANIDKVILMAGANDVEKGKVDQMICGMNQILQIILKRFPNSKIYIFGVYPRRSENEKISEENLAAIVKEFNARLEKVVLDSSGGARNCSFHNFGSDVLVSETGKIDQSFFEDSVHFNLQGYRLLAKHIEEILNE